MSEELLERNFDVAIVQDVAGHPDRDHLAIYGLYVTRGDVRHASELYPGGRNSETFSGIVMRLLLAGF